jgi:hypothetical protein
VLVAAVVEMMSVAVALPVPKRITGLVPPKLKVGRSCAPAGLDVMAAVSATLPENPPEGMTVMMVLVPVVAPGWTATLGPETVKSGTVTVTVFDPEELT